MSERPPKFTLFPKEWGIYLPYSGKAVKLSDGDAEALEALKEALAHKQGELIEYKWDIKPLGIIKVTTLFRLWANDLIIKFAKQMHTISNRPEYIRWYIWGDYERRTDSDDGGYPAAPRYISER